MAGAGLVLLVGLAGGVGAACRFLVTEVVAGAVTGRGHGAGRERESALGALRGPPWATIGINLVGSLVLGLLTGLAAGHLVGAEAAAVAGTGFCGGFTTFSTATVETLRLARRGASAAAVVNAVGTAVGALAAAGLGWWLGTVLAS